MKTESYADFSLRLHGASAGKRIPVNATLELTYRCNNNCVHCFCSLPAGDETAKQRELTTAEIRALFDEMASMGALWLLITGGEPLLRPDFGEIYRYARQKGFLVSFFTNGTMISRDIVDILASYPPFVVEITLYGATEETCEKVTGVKGSYRRCIEGIENIKKAGIPLKLKTMALTINQHEVGEMDRMARAWGCEFRFDPVIQKRIDGKAYSSPEQYRISPEDAVRLDLAFPKRIEAYRLFCEKFVETPPASDRLYRCGAGVSSLHVNPYGMTAGCSMMVKDAFSLREKGMRWIWEEGIRSVISRKKTFALPCDDCRLVNLCGQCPPWSMLENGSPDKEVAYLCEIAKMKENEYVFLQ
ncbi:MAG: radical SAM protein [Nitrospiraceae bacterium]|nr:radical SAM protein [Nitrospiraceae bacterium]